MQAAAATPQTSSPATAENPPSDLRSVKKFKATKRSFAEAASSVPMLEGNTTSDSSSELWYMEDPVLELDCEGLNEDLRDGVPVIRLPKDLRMELCREWKKALIVKYVGKPVGFALFKHRLMRLWNLKGKSDMLDIGVGFYIIRFELEKDYMHALMDGPWKIFDRYVAVQRWKPDFDPTTAEISTMAVWVRLPGLPVEYFRDDIIRMILEKVGTPLKLDRTTAGVERGKFARAAVELDLSKPLVSMVWIQNRLQRVEYEALHVVCFNCGSVGHREKDCASHARSEPTETHDRNTHSNTMETDSGVEQNSHDPPIHVKEGNGKQLAKYGEWMLIKNKPKPRRRTEKEKPRQDTRNSFEVLGNESSLDTILEENQVVITPGRANLNAGGTVDGQAGKVTLNTTSFLTCRNLWNSRTHPLPLIRISRASS